eukprot:3009231-Heterocapsa_arctica.AAC.1
MSSTSVCAAASCATAIFGSAACAARLPVPSWRPHFYEFLDDDEFAALSSGSENGGPAGRALRDG